MRKDFILHTILEDLWVVAFFMVDIFGIILFYELTGSIILAVLPYVILFFLYAIQLPFLSKVVGVLGTRMSLVLASLLLTLSIVPLYVFSISHSVISLAAWILLISLGKVFFHTPLLLGLGHSTQVETRGTSFGIKRVSLYFAAITGPIMAGVLSSHLGFAGLAVGSGMTYLLMIIPASQISNEKYSVTLSVRTMMRAKKGCKIAKLSLVAAIVQFSNRLWPIYVFIILGESLLYLGGFLVIVFTISMLLSISVGKLLDRTDRLKFLERDVIGILITSCFRGIASTPLGIFLADISYNFNSIFADSAIEVITYDLMNTGIGHSKRDEIVIFREFILNIFIALSLLFGAIIASLFGFTAYFIFVGFAAFGFLLI